MQVLDVLNVDSLHDIVFLRGVLGLEGCHYFVLEFGLGFLLHLGVLIQKHDFIGYRGADGLGASEEEGEAFVDDHLVVSEEVCL